MTTNFGKVKEFMIAFAQPVYTEQDSGLLSIDKKRTQLRMDLIDEELKELKVAIAENNYIEVFDALLDILYVTYGAGATFGFDLDTEFRKLYEVNDTSTNFEVVKRIMIKFEAVYIRQNPSLITGKNVEQKIKLIDDDVTELRSAIDNNVYDDICDALINILYSTYYAGAAFGFNLDDGFNEVHNSNMSKLCTSEEEAMETVVFYKKRKLDVYPNPMFKKIATDKWMVYEESTGKVLKSINWHEPELSEHSKLSGLSEHSKLSGLSELSNF
jgi:predicted HAD superfamily Cof-like phosphohydrolase